MNLLCRLLAVFAGAHVVLGAPALVTVNGPIYTPGGFVANGGSIKVTLAAPCTVGGEVIARGPHVIPIGADGTIVYQLAPTATCGTGNSYRAVIAARLNGVPLAETTETWTIPATPSSTTIAAIRADVAPAWSASFPWTSITSVPASITALSGTASANHIWAGPTSGGAAAGSYRTLVVADLPSHSHAAGDLTSGVLAEARVPSTLSALTVSGALSFGGVPSGSSPYLQVESAGNTFDLKAALGGVRVLNNAGTAAVLTITNAGALTATSFSGAIDGASLTTGTVPQARLQGIFPNLGGFFLGGGAGLVQCQYYSNGCSFASSYAVNWSSTSAANGTLDVGVVRGSAGRLKITNGSTGSGALDAAEVKVTDSAAPSNQYLRLASPNGGAWYDVDSYAAVLRIGTVNSGYNLLFKTSNSTRMYVDGNTGYVGIGNTAAAYPLDVTGTVNAAAYRVGGAAGLTQTITVRASGGASDCTITFTGGIATGTTCP